jgi:drug/metabolite transporter superfamily protein YnfA
MTFLTWIIFFTAALLEVGGDAAIRRGLRGGGLLSLLAGLVFLGFYGLAVNSVKADFSKAFGGYVAFFALVSVLCGHYVFKDSVPASTWIGLAIIMIGGLIIQLGHR